MKLSLYNRKWNMKGDMSRLEIELAQKVRRITYLESKLKRKKPTKRPLTTPQKEAYACDNVYIYFMTVIVTVCIPYIYFVVVL